MKETIIYFKHNNKKIPLVLTEPKDEKYKNYPEAIWADCKEAGFSQIRDKTDIAALVEILPDYIDELEKENKSSFIRVRVKGDEKVKISRLAKNHGFKSVSEYIRARALAE